MSNKNYIIVSVFVIILSSWLSFDLGVKKANRDIQSDIDMILESNQDVFHEMGATADQMSKNTDVMMRFGHYLEDHQPGEQHALCPECTSPENMDLVIGDYPEEEVPSTLKQLLRDSDEFRRAFGSSRMGLLHQKVKLDHTLNQMKEKSIQ